MPRMTPEKLALEIKKILMCPDSHKIEFIEETVSTIFDSHAEGLPSFSSDEDNNNGPIESSVLARYLCHYHIQDGKIFQVKTLISDYLWQIMISGSNPTEQKNMYTEWAHAIVTSCLINGVPTADNHLDFVLQKYPVK